MRRAWFDHLHVWAMLVVCVSGTSAFLAIVDGQHPELAKWLALLVSALALMDIVFKWSEKAREHDMLNRRFHELSQALNQEVARLPDEEDELNGKKLAALQNQRLDIEADEPTGLDALNVICHNIQVQAEGGNKDEIIPVRRYQSIFSQICTLPPNDFGK